MVWIKRAVKSDNWDIIITCSVIATKCLNELNINTFANYPHPVSFAWRSQMMIDLKKEQNKIK